MVAFVLCIRKRSPNDKHALDTVIKAARLVEKQARYDFLGYFDAIPIIDFFSKRQSQQILTADSVELVQTSVILDKVRDCFAEAQEREILQLWGCTSVALVCRDFCPRGVGSVITDASLQSRRTLRRDVARAFKRLQSVVLRSKSRGLRLLKDELMKITHGYSIESGLITPASDRADSVHDFWTRTFGEIANRVELNDEIVLNAYGQPAAISNRSRFNFNQLPPTTLMDRGNEIKTITAGNVVKDTENAILESVEVNISQRPISDTEKMTDHHTATAMTGGIVTFASAQDAMNENRKS